MIPVSPRQYARVVGIIVLIFGILGIIVKLIANTDQLIGLNISWTENIIHVITGGLMAYIAYVGYKSSAWLAKRAEGEQYMHMAVGYGYHEAVLARMIVGGVGVVYLLIGIVGWFSPSLFGILSTSSYTGADNIVHLLLGVIGVVIAFGGWDQVY